MSGTLRVSNEFFFSLVKQERKKKKNSKRTSFIGHRNGRSIRLPLYITDCTRRTEEILLYIYTHIYLIIAIEPSRLSRENDVNRGRERRRRRRNVGLGRSKKDGSRAQRARGERNGLNEERERECAARGTEKRVERKVAMPTAAAVQGLRFLSSHSLPLALSLTRPCLFPIFILFSALSLSSSPSPRPF